MYISSDYWLSASWIIDILEHIGRHLKINWLCGGSGQVGHHPKVCFSLQIGPLMTIINCFTCDFCNIPDVCVCVCM